MGTPIEPDLTLDNYIIDPLFQNPPDWTLTGDWAIVAGVAQFRQGAIPKIHMLRYAHLLAHQINYAIGVKLSNINLDPADELQLHFHNTHVDIPKIAGEPQIFVIKKTFGGAFTRLTIETFAANNQTIDVEFYNCFDTINLNIIPYNMIGRFPGTYDIFELPGAESMSFYARRWDRTRVWIKNG